MTAEEIEKDVLKRIQTAFEKAAYEISYEIESHYEQYIDAFYDSYTPFVYDRHFNLYKASTGGKDISSEIKYSNNLKNSWFEAGIRVSPSLIGDPYKDPSDYVFDRSYFYGIHGTIKTGGVMVVPPERLMDMWFEGFKANIGSYIKKYF